MNILLFPVNNFCLNDHTPRFQQKILKTVATFVMLQCLTLEVKMLNTYTVDKSIFGI